MRLPISIPPGLRRDGTEGQSRGRWLRSSLVRGYGADVGPVLGWRRRSEHAVPGTARALLAWRSAPDTRLIAVGAHLGLFIQNAGGSVFDITPADFVAGEADAAINTGFGGGLFGSGSFGTPRIDTGSIRPAAVWTLDNWGRYLVGCCASDGRLLEWTLNTGVDAAAISNAPTACAGLVATQDRFLVALGASGNARLLAWCDQEDNTAWTASATNQAGDQELDSEGGVVTAVELRGQTLVLTDMDAHVMQYIGPPFVFAIQKAGEGCGAISVGCAVDQGDWAMWWSRSGFWRFDGTVTAVDCPLRDLDFGLNQTQRSKITGWHNAKHNEIWWSYPSAASTENDRYVSFNYKTGEWWEGAMGRLAGRGAGLFSFPLGIEADGYVLEQEVGGNYDGATPFVRSGPITLGDGERTMRVAGLIPDVAGACRVGFETRDHPNSTPVEIAAVNLAAGRTDLRFTARQVELEVRFDSPDARFGAAFLEVAAGGTR
jgi:hypothetical protein